jgi:phosphoribosylanthranilate isomerase
MCSCFSCWSATHSPCIYFCVAKAPDKAVTGVLLLDSHQVGDRQIGVLGATYSWEIDRKIVESVNIFIIAGGLGPHNVVDAITVV